MDKKITYTESAKECIEKLKENYIKEIESLIIERKNLPGEDVIEITASDVNEASRSLLLIKRFKQRETYSLIIYLYFIFGIILTVIGIFSDSIKNILAKNPTRGTFLVIGIFTVSLSFIVMQFLKRKDQILKRRIESDILKHNIEKVEDALAKAKKELSENVEWVNDSKSAETARLHATIAFDKQWWGVAAVWWSRAIILYAKVNDETLLSVSTNGLNNSLNKCDKLTKKEKEEVESCISSIPESLFLIKNNITKRMSTIQEAD
jgi:hypothetical protein